MSDRIECTPDICHGAPVIRGTRVLVETIAGARAAGDSDELIMEDYPVTREDIRVAELSALHGVAYGHAVLLGKHAATRAYGPMDGRSLEEIRAARERLLPPEQRLE